MHHVAVWAKDKKVPLGVILLMVFIGYQLGARGHVWLMNTFLPRVDATVIRQEASATSEALADHIQAAEIRHVKAQLSDARRSLFDVQIMIQREGDSELGTRRESELRNEIRDLEIQLECLRDDSCRG